MHLLEKLLQIGTTLVPHPCFREQPTSISPLKDTQCSDGTVFTGCNIENAAYGVTICAERTAIFKAVSEGRRDFVRIAIAGRSEDYCVPCGSCRQVMMEFAPELEVICLNGKGESKTFALRELLPYGFDRTWL